MITQVLQMPLKSANERMTFHHKKDHGIKVLLEKVKMAAKTEKRALQIIRHK